MRKVDDKKLLELIDSGMSQKDAATHFSVSPVWIHKRLKHLKLATPPQSLEVLTPPQRGFVLAVARGESKTNAAMKCYETSSRESAKQIGIQLAKDPKIQTAITDCRNSIAQRFEEKGYGVDFRVGKIGEKMEHPDPIVSLKATDMATKLCGDDQEAARQTTSHNYTEIDLSQFTKKPTSHLTNRELTQADLDSHTIAEHLTEMRERVSILEGLQEKQGGNE